MEISKAQFRKAEYGGGTVMLWDRGFWAPETGGNPEHALSKGRVEIRPRGRKVEGQLGALFGCDTIASGAERALATTGC